MIERASQTVESVSQHERQLVWDDRNLLHTKTYLVRFDAILPPDSVWVGTPKILYGGFKTADVLSGPTVFC